MKIKLRKINLAPAFNLSLVYGKQFLLEINHKSYVLRWNKSFFVSQVKLELNQILHYNGDVSQINVCPRLDKIWSFVVHLRRIRDIFMAAAWMVNYLLHILQETKQNSGHKITTNIFWNIEIPTIILGVFVFIFFFLPSSENVFMLMSFLKILGKTFQSFSPFCCPFVGSLLETKWPFCFCWNFIQSLFKIFFSRVIEADRDLYITYLAIGWRFLCPTLTLLLCSLSLVSAA